MTNTRKILSAVSIWTLFTIPALRGDSLTPADLTAPFAVQPFAGLMVMGGMSEPFFSDLSALTFATPDIVTVLSNIQAFDDMGNPVSMFQVTGITVMQGMSTLSPMVDTFDVTSPTTYTSTLNSNQATVTPGALNLAFTFTSDSSFMYSYALTTTGIPDGGFVLYDDIEGAKTPEPSFLFPLALLLGVVTLWRGRANQRA